MTSIKETPEELDIDNATSVYDVDCSEAAHKMTTDWGHTKVWSVLEQKLIPLIT